MKLYNDIEKLQEIMWRHDDRIDQTSLFEAQELLADIALKIACNEGEVERLAKRFPFLYEKVNG